MKFISSFQFTNEQFQQIQALGIQMQQVSAKELAVADYTGVEGLIIGQNYEPLDYSRMTDVRLLQLSSVGADMLPLEMLNAMGIQVCNNRGAFSIPIAEMVLTYILMLSKSMSKFGEQQRTHTYKKMYSLQEVHGKRVLILGTGSIGVEIAKRLQAFGCEVIGANRSGSMRHYFDRCVALNTAELLLASIDILIMALPSSPSTNQWLNQERLNLLNQEAIVVNVGRGSLIDEVALIAALEHGKLAGVALDVFASEPLVETSRLWDLPNVIITPHNSFAGTNNNERTFANILATVQAYVAKHPLPNQINGK